MKLKLIIDNANNKVKLLDSLTSHSFSSKDIVLSKSGNDILTEAVGRSKYATTKQNNSPYAEVNLSADESYFSQDNSNPTIFHLGTYDLDISIQETNPQQSNGLYVMEYDLDTTNSTLDVKPLDLTSTTYLLTTEGAGTDQIHIYVI